jgi:hypothetical protein
MNRTNCIDRAGEILIFTIWVEKRLVDLLILKKHPILIKKVNNSSKLPRTMVDERFKYWEKSFWLILDEYIKEFKPKNDWIESLRGVAYWRDIIGHGHVSLYRSYLLYRPNTTRKGKSVKELRSALGSSKTKGKSARKFTLKIDFSNNLKYENMKKVIIEIDEVLLKYEANKLGLNYEKIR